MAKTDNDDDYERPVSVSVRGTEGEAVVDERRVDHGRLFGEVEQVVEIAEMPVTAAHAVARAVLVQHEHLARTEPALHTHQSVSQSFSQIKTGKGMAVVKVVM